MNHSNRNRRPVVRWPVHRGEGVITRVLVVFLCGVQVRLYFVWLDIVLQLLYPLALALTPAVHAEVNSSNQDVVVNAAQRLPDLGSSASSTAYSFKAEAFKRLSRWNPVTCFPLPILATRQSLALFRWGSLLSMAPLIIGCGSLVLSLFHLIQLARALLIFCCTCWKARISSLYTLLGARCSVLGARCSVRAH